MIAVDLPAQVNCVIVNKKQGFAARAIIPLLYLSVTATLIPGTAALSQDRSELDADVDAIVEIVVTARKVEENVRDIPLSVRVLSADFLDDANQAQPSVVTGCNSFSRATLGWVVRCAKFA